MRIISRHYRGFTTIGAIVSLSILFAMASGLAALVAANHKGRISQTYADQSYYVSQAALEYSLRNVRALHNSSVPNRQFLGTSFAITSGTKIASAVSYGGAGMSSANAFSITNPGSGGVGCIYVLAPSGSGALNMTGSGNLTASACTINVNSSDSSAISLVGGAVITATTTNIVGDYMLCGGHISGTINTNTTAVSDPLSTFNIPSYSSCTFTNTTILSNTTLNPGVYCGGISIVGSPTVTMNPGNYILDGGTFSVTGSPNITGNGVTIFLNKQLQGSYAQFNLTMSGGSLTLKAPTAGQFSGALAGIAIFQSRSAPNGTANIVGTTSLNITGAIYFPNQTLNYVGGSSSSAPCTMLVANKLNITGSANISCTSGALGGLIH